MSTNAHPARRRWRLVLVPVAAVSLAGLVACGTGADASTGSSDGAPDDSAMAAFASCMAENGVTLPERGAPDGGTGGAGSAGGAAAGSGGAGAGSAGGAAAGSGGAGGAAGPGAGGASPHPGAPQAGGAGAMPAPPGVDATAWAAAQEACAQYAPTSPAS